MAKEKLDIWVKFRVTKNQMTFLQNSAEVYACGDISKWLRYCFMNYLIPKELLKKRVPEKRTPKGANLKQ